MRNKLQLTPAQQTVQAIDLELDRLDRNATPVINQLTELLASSEDPQAIFDIWGTDALQTLLDVKKTAAGLKALGANIIELRDDFALPEIVDGKPTGRLNHNPLPEVEPEVPENG